MKEMVQKYITINGIKVLCNVPDSLLVEVKDGRNTGRRPKTRITK